MLGREKAREKVYELDCRLWMSVWAPGKGEVAVRAD